ncbi:rab11 family-interacting protein 4A isoform X2 [Cardiocondyla obscurior]|uniref:rab11 family-interacting protein 4A isoform X2 n=1 Tax=Cardiocondyla obscurior TaxID=286306 RepID=UPI0039656093
MCASRSRRTYGAQRNFDRNHLNSAVQPFHSVPYQFYPSPPYPPFPPYDPYAAYHYTGSFYPTPYCAHQDVTKEEPTGWALSTVAILTFLVIGSLVIVYRCISRETRRKIISWLRSPRLTLQVQMIQEQMDALADTKSVGEERYARAKQENATLQARILMLEEAAKDAETRAEERLQTEQRRHRELNSRLERERQLQLENYAIKLQAAEVDSSSLREEIARIREQLERARADKTRLENDLREARREADAARESERHAISRANEAHHMLDAMKEELSLRNEDQQRIEELVQQVAQLQAFNKSLEESRDELQAAVALQAGRELLMLNPCNNNAEKGPSLAVELLAGMNPDQIDGQGEFNEPCTMAELKQALKEQQEVNTQLRTYIDGILLNIVENYPQLLEVKQTH